MVNKDIVMNSQFENWLCRLCQMNAKADVLLKKKELGYKLKKSEMEEISEKLQDAKEQYLLLREPFTTGAEDGEPFDFFEDVAFQGFQMKNSRFYGDAEQVEKLALPFYENPANLYQHELGVLLLFHSYEMKDFWRKNKKREKLRKKWYCRIFYKVKGIFLKRKLLLKTGDVDPV